jgi:hypothetical protein
MSISLTSIHQPLTDFFLNQFQTEAGSQILFRFDKYGSVLSEQDFIDERHPEFGYLSVLAMEKFSDLVNHIPTECNDGLNVLLSNDSIDTTYFFRLLSASMPYLSNEADDATKQAMISSFSEVKAESLKVWKNIKAESISGLMLQYKPSLATPENWYDLSKNDVWISHSFQVAETSSETTPRASDRLWRLKLSDVAMRQAMQLPETGNDDSNVNIADHILQLNIGSISDRINRVDLGQVGQVSGHLADHLNRIDVGQIAQLNPLSDSVSRIDRGQIERVTSRIADRVNVDQFRSVALHDTYLRQYSQLDVSKRLVVGKYLSQEAPTQTVKTNSFSISFDYCLVKIRRPWYVDAFINETSWCLPNVSKGQMTMSGVTGSLPLLPIGFVAIRNLNIEANWDREDVTNSAVATNFGPFKVETQIVNNKLSHPGLQIIGWLLQKMPELPPNPPE